MGRRGAVFLEVASHSFKSLCFGPRRDRLSPRRVWSWAPGDCASSKGRSGCFRGVFIIQYLFSSYFSFYSSSYSGFCWQGHKKQAFCDSILKIKNILSFFATHRKLGSRGPASKIVNKNWNKNWNKN